MENYTCQRGRGRYEQFVQSDVNDGEYLDIMVTTCNQSATKYSCNSSTTYGPASQAYFTSSNMTDVPGCYPSQTSINCRYLEKIPYNVTYSLRQPSLITATIKCEFIVPSIYSGILEKTLDIICCKRHSPQNKQVFTTVYFELDRPAHHSLLLQTEDQEL